MASVPVETKLQAIRKFACEIKGFTGWPEAKNRQILEDSARAMLHVVLNRKPTDEEVEFIIPKSAK